MEKKSSTHFLSDSYTKKEKKNPRILLRKTSRKAELSFPDRVAFLQKKRKRISNDPFRSFEERRSNSIGVASTDTKGALSVRTPKINKKKQQRMKHKDSLYKLISQNSHSANYRERLNRYNEFDSYNEEIKEKDKQITMLTRTIREMKRKLSSRFASAPVSYNALPASEREKFEMLLNENRVLKEENHKLKMKNEYLTRRLEEQSKVIQVGLNRKVNDRKKKKSNNQESMVNIILKWYYKMSDQMEKITVSTFKNMKNYSFVKCFNYCLRDFLYVLPAERYMYTIVIDDKISDIMDRPVELGPNPCIEDFYPSKLPEEAVNKLRRLQKNVKDMREIVHEGAFCYIPIRMILPHEVVLRTIGVLAIERKSRQKEISNTQKMMIKCIIYFIAFLIIIYKERRRYDVIRGMFKSFSVKICEFLETKEISNLLITLKIELSKIFEAEDVTVAIFNKNDSLFYALNPSYSLTDYKQISELELNKFSTSIGITSRVLKSGDTFFTKNPRSDPNFTSQIDNLTPLFVLHNLTIARLETSSRKVIGIVQIINQKKKMSTTDYVDMVNSISKTLANVIEYCVRGFDNERKMEKVKGGVDVMRELLSSSKV